MESCYYIRTKHVESKDREKVQQKVSLFSVFLAPSSFVVVVVVVVVLYFPLSCEALSLRARIISGYISPMWM